MMCDKVELALAIGSWVLAVISVLTVVITLSQNHKMIENTTRPYLGVRCEAVVIPKEVARYAVIQNFGQSSAKILSMECSGDAAADFKNRVKMLTGTTLAPGQRVIYYFGGANPGTPEQVTFTLKYRGSGKKEYTEETNLNMVVGTIAKRSEDNLASSFALQEIAFRLF